ncbi:MAG TPA: cyclic nucleotide-binding and patatin-like phospholipase domain-containing protein [Acidimicrobiia bacterium]|jgi:predicted acylesterase/phospholipase RssA/CRP-like cAMP-binding protein
MTALSDAELDRLVRENRVFGTLGGEARAQLRGALEPLAVPGGTVLIREGDPADCLYLVAAGRLRVVTTDPDGEERELAEIGRGDLVGEMALITQRARTATVHVLRDSHLLRLSTGAFTRFIADHPESARRISTEMVDRLLRSRVVGRPSTPVVTIALVPLGPEPAVRSFSAQLERALGRLTGSVRQIDSVAATAMLGDELEGLAAWSEELETEHEVVIYRADREPTPWTRASVRQADLVLLVADATTPPDRREVEDAASGREQLGHQRAELVLVHPGWTEDPRGTTRWLAPRRLDRHHHVRADRPADADRVARLVLSRGVGVVYSGGGARGIAELGVLKALREADVPIDAAGGTSIGSILAGATASDMDLEATARLLRAALVEGKSPVDITLPVVSLAAGARVSERMQTAARGLDLEDQWLNGFCVSTNLTRGEVEVHRTGPAWLGLRASFSIPGVFPPMRTADGDVLVDGGVLDNMPVGIMRGLHDGIRVIAVDVGSKRDIRAGQLPHTGVVSGWKILMQRADPRLASPEMAGIIRVIMRITELGGSGAADLGDLYIRPPVDGIAMLEFSAFDQLVELGYAAASTAIEAWLSSANAPAF